MGGDGMMPDQVVVGRGTMPEYGKNGTGLFVLDPGEETEKYAGLLREEEDRCCILAEFTRTDHFTALRDAAEAVVRRVTCYGCAEDPCHSEEICEMTRLKEVLAALPKREAPTPAEKGRTE